MYLFSLQIFLKNPLLPEYCNETISNSSFLDADSNYSLLIIDSSNNFTFEDDLGNSSSFALDSTTSPYYISDKPLTRGPKPNTALFSTILMIGTFYIAYFLRHFRNSKFLGRSVSVSFFYFLKNFSSISKLLMNVFSVIIYFPVIFLVKLKTFIS